MCIYSTFLQRAFDQVTWTSAMHRLPVVFVLDRAGVTGPDGASHHGIFDLSYLRFIPDMNVAAPSDAGRAVPLLETASRRRRAGRASASRAARSPAPGTCRSSRSRWAGGRCCARAATVALIAIGKMVAVAEAAADRLSAAGVTATVVDARFAKPVDPDLPGLVERHRAALTLEDGTVRGGFGSGVLEALAAAGVTVPVRVLGLPDAFIEHGQQAWLLKDLGLDVDGVVAAARALLHSDAESALAG